MVDNSHEQLIKTLNFILTLSHGALLNIVRIKVPADGSIMAPRSFEQSILVSLPQRMSPAAVVHHKAVNATA